MSKPHPFFVIWTGALNLGDTPGVFTDAQFVGLLVQLPITLTFVPGTALQLLLLTTQVEIFNAKKHPVYWDWVPGTPYGTPIGYIDDTDPIPGRPEYHLLTVPSPEATLGPHTLTIHVNPDIPAGLRDDFVLKRIECSDSAGAKVGWTS